MGRGREEGREGGKEGRREGREGRGGGVDLCTRSHSHSLSCHSDRRPLNYQDKLSPHSTTYGL